MKAPLASAKYLTWFNHLGRGCVANLTHMLQNYLLQTSSVNQAHVVVASNSISLFCLEGRTNINNYFIKSIAISHCQLALKILREILLFTSLFMINTCPLVGCLENSDRKVKQFCVIPQIASSHLVYCLSRVWFCSATPNICIMKLSRNKHPAKQTAWPETGF